MVLKKASKSERMKKEYDENMSRLNHTEYSMKVLEMMYANFRSYDKSTRYFDQNDYSQWYNSTIRPIVGAYLKRTRSVINNPRTYVPFRVICDVNNAMTSQLRDKYRLSDKSENIRRAFLTSQMGLENYYSRVC